MATTTRSGQLRRGRLPNYYRVLGVAPRAPVKAIEDAYWEQAFSIHARDESRARHRRLARLNDAYRVLVSPRLRDEYDAAHNWPEEQEEARGWWQRLRGRLYRGRTRGEPADS